jgi:hypothetical protein
MRTLEYAAKMQAAYLRCANRAVNSETFANQKRKHKW